MQGIWQTSPTEIMEVFRSALRSMVPFAEKMKISWREPDNYDNWDRIASALFETFVVDFVIDAEECAGWPKIIDYDRRPSTYSSVDAYVFDASEGAFVPFVCLESSQEAFDTCLFYKIDSQGNPIGECRKPFSYVSWRVCSGVIKQDVADALTVDVWC